MIRSTTRLTGLLVGVRFRLVPAGICALLGLPSCGSHPPVVRSAFQAYQLSANTTSVRARGMSDTDLVALARLHELRFVCFFSGLAVTENRLTDKGVAVLAEMNLPVLSTLHLGPSKEISDAAMPALASMTPLRHLGLADCPRITDGGLPVIGRMHHLRGLDLRGNTGITDVGLDELGALINLRLLILDGCPNVSRSALARLTAALPECVVLKDDSAWSRKMRRAGTPLD